VIPYDLYFPVRAERIVHLTPCSLFSDPTFRFCARSSEKPLVRVPWDRGSYNLIGGFSDSKKAVQSRGGHRDIQAAHPLDGTRKPIPPSLRPRPPLRLFAQIRQKPDDCTKYAHRPSFPLHFLTKPRI
jgi:hypothetical protein